MTTSIFLDKMVPAGFIAGKRSEFKGDIQWIALTPTAVYSLEKSDTDYLTLDEFAPGIRIFEEEERLKEKLKTFYLPEGEFAQYAKNKNLILDVGGYLFSRWVVQIETGLFRINSYLEQARPQKIQYFREKDPSSRHKPSAQIPDLHIKCLELLADEKGIKLETVQLTEDYYPENSSSVSYRKSLTNRLADKITNAYLRLIPSGSFKKILLGGLTYDLEYLAYEPNLKRKFEFFYFDCNRPDRFPDGPIPLKDKLNHENLRQNDTAADDELSDSINEIYQQLQREAWYKEYFVWNGLDYGKIIKDSMDWMFNRYILEVNSYFRRHCNWLKSLQIDLVMVPYLKNSSSNTALWYAAEKYKIPFVIYQHGGCYGYWYLPTRGLFEFNYPTPFFSYGNGLREQLKWNNVEFLNLLPVGSLRMNHLSREKKYHRNFRKQLEGKACKYIVTYCSDIICPSYIHPVRLNLSLETYRFQIELAELFIKYPEIYFIIKCHRLDKQYNPLPNYIADRGITNCSVLYEPSFSIYASISDLVIFDSLSTGFLETLSLGVPICVYGSGYKIYPELMIELKESLLYEDDVKTFIAGLEKKLYSLVHGDGNLMRELSPAARNSILIDDNAVPHRIEHALDRLLNLE